MADNGGHVRVVVRESPSSARSGGARTLVVGERIELVCEGRESVSCSYLSSLFCHIKSQPIQFCSGNRG